MSSIFKIDLISELIKKLELGIISQGEQDYLEKLIASTMLVQQYNKVRIQKTELFILSYYEWLYKNLNSEKFTPEKKTNFYLLQLEIEKYFRFFGEKRFEESQSEFQKCQTIAKFWGQNILKQKDDILKFMFFFLEKVYDIPRIYILEIFELLKKNWKPTLAPIGLISEKKYSLLEIEDYFFSKNKRNFQTHILPNIDRLFTVLSPEFENHLFIPKLENFDVFEAAQVVHEFHHLQEHTNCMTTSLYEKEKNALGAEKVFLNAMGTGKQGRFYWAEANLFYPAILLAWEIDVILKETTNREYFAKICSNHSMESIPLSIFFDWKSPFQMSVYCAASMDLEPTWKGFLKSFD